MLLLAAIAVFIPTKLIQLFIRDWRRWNDGGMDRGFQEQMRLLRWIAGVLALVIIGVIYWRWLISSGACDGAGCRWP